MDQKYDLIVIGTGFASTFFLHKYLSLQRSPRKILILERGRRHDLGWKLQNRNAMESYGVVSDINYKSTFYNRNRDKDWVCNVAFGGGSNCWWGCTPRFLPNDFKLKSLYGIGHDWPISYDELEPFYSEAEEIMQISGPNDHICYRSKDFPQPAHEMNAVDKLLKNAFPDKYFAQPTARARVATPKRPRCCASGVCYLCPVNAKFTIENDLGEMFSKDDIQVEYGAEARWLNFERDQVRSVCYFKDGREYEVGGEVVALGANAIFNSAILLNSGQKHRHLGANLSEQASLMVKVKLRGVKNFTGSTSLTANGYMMYDGEHRKKYGACLIESSNIPTFRLEKDRHTEVAVFKIIIEDLPQLNNRVIIKDRADKPELLYFGYSDYVLKAWKKIPALLEPLLSSLPVEEIEYAPTLGKSEAHILGTTVMGVDPEASIIDPDLVHHQYRNLFVLGGGAFPTISPANPTLTLSALSLRAAERAFK